MAAKPIYNLVKAGEGIEEGDRLHLTTNAEPTERPKDVLNEHYPRRVLELSRIITCAMEELMEVAADYKREADENREAAEKLKKLMEVLNG